MVRFAADTIFMPYHCQVCVLLSSQLSKGERMTPVLRALTVLLVAGLVLPLALAAQAAELPRDVAAMREAMTKLRSGDWTGAHAAAEPAGQLGTDIIEWHRLRQGRGNFDEVTGFLDRRADWPGLKLLRRRSEGSLPYRARAEDVVAFFATQPPQTGAGSVLLANAYETLGQTGDAEAQIVLAWLTQDISTADQTRLLKSHGDLLKPYHEARLDRLLWDGKDRAAKRMYPHVSRGWQALAKARIALRDDKNGVDGLIKAVPKDLQDDAGLAFERFQWRARRGRNAEAIELAVERGATEEALGQPIKWAGWRRTLARWAMRQGKDKDAYALASAHGLSAGASYADLEWLSGYLALRKLDDPEAALGHFRAFRAAVQTPISLGRAGYWEGRALEALDRPEEARMAYAFGGRFQTSFYGLLAAERAGLPMHPSLTGETVYPDWREAGFASSSVFAAADLLQSAGERDLAERFLRHLSETQSPRAVGQLTDFALERQEPHIALMIAKEGAKRGIVVPRAYFPVVDLGLEEMPVPDALALSIARRESEFDHKVMSGVGARGLMQVMPATAKEVAGWLDLPYSRERLITDPVYNATLGTAYLAELSQIFGNNYLLVSAGYNAGPGRPRRWMEINGDPRKEGVDAVDWIEHIPFRETRNYAMRVMESLPVYRARLTGEVEPLRLSEELRRFRPGPPPDAPATR